MTDQDAFLSAIRAAPDADGPRLVYADWLEEHGHDERAEFIRVQCELARPISDKDTLKRLQKREKELLRKYGLRWAVHLKPLAYEIAYARGFVEYATYATGSIERSANEIVALAQSEAIRHLRDESQLLSLRHILKALRQLGHLESLELWFLATYKDDELRRLLTSRHLKNLKRLILNTDRSGREAPDEVLIETVGLPCRSKLTELALQVGPDYGLTNAVIQAIANSRYLANLSRLFLQVTRMDLATARAFVESPYLRKLTALDLSYGECSVQVWETLLNGPNLQGLRWLGLGSSSITRTRQSLESHKLRQAFDNRFGTEVTDWESGFIAPWDSPRNPLAAFWKGLKLYRSHR